MENDVIVAASYKPPSLLPIAKYRENLLYAIETYPVTVLIGETGSGKSTQIPQYLNAAGWNRSGKCIAVTQPRRVAATTVAQRVADEMRVKLGTQVGYTIRFEDLSSSLTQIKFLTDGMLLREALIDPLLSRYSVIMVDEAHERSLASDVLLGLLKKIRRKRPELRIIISSATIQAERFLDYFTKELEGVPPENDVARILSIEGRSFPVDVLFSEKPVEDYITAAVEAVLQINSSEGPGDVLVFFPGRSDIENATRQLQDYSDSNKLSLQILPLYAGLPTDEQMLVFDKSADLRKVILATNIAEASVTIDGISFVIDTGFVKLRAFDPSTGISALVTVPVSKASANQRAGRAGRTAPGKCFRLYKESTYSQFELATCPEIQRVELSSLILQLKALGIDNIAKFDFITSPPSRLVARSLELLFALGALDDYGKLTRPLGLRMAELSLEPMMSKALLESVSFKCVNEMLIIAAMTSLQGNIWVLYEAKAMESCRRKVAAEEGDHITMLNLFLAFTSPKVKDAKWAYQNHVNYQSLLRAVSIRKQLQRQWERFGIVVERKPTLATSRDDKPTAETICRCLTTGYFTHVAKMQPDGSFHTINGKTKLHAHPSSLLFNRKAEWVIFHEILETGDKIYIRDITKIQKPWLLEYAQGYYQS